MRGNLLDVLESDYVKFARAKGLSENKVIYKHALRNAINPMVTLLGFEFASLLSGAALTEYVFQYPGLGRLILEAVMKSDINLVHGDDSKYSIYDYIEIVPTNANYDGLEFSSSDDNIALSVPHPFQ